MSIGIGMGISPVLQSVALGGAAFSPTDIAGLLLWLDFSDASTLFVDAGITPVSSDGDAIYQINDKSGNGNNFIQTDSNFRPLYKTSVQNALDAGLFDGSNDQLIATATALDLFRNIGSASIYTSVKHTVSEPNRIPFSASTATGAGFARVLNQTGAGNTYRIGGRRLDADAFDDTAGGTVSVNWIYYHNLFDWSNSDLYSYVNGGLISSNLTFQTAGNTSDTDSQRITVGAIGNPGASFMYGYIGEILVYVPALTGANVTQVNNYMTRWT